MDTKYFTRKETAEYLSKTLGLPTSPKTLAKLATIGGGPEYQRFGNRRVVYTLTSITKWAQAKLSKPIFNTSQEL